MKKYEFKSQEIEKLFGQTLNYIGANANDEIIGISVTKKPYTGLRLKLLGRVETSDKYINCDFIILGLGNCVLNNAEFQKYIDDNSIVNLKQFVGLTDTYFKIEFFTKAIYVAKYPLRFNVGDFAKITKDANIGNIARIKYIEKYPDDNKAKESDYCAYYYYEFNGIEGNKLDKSLEKIEISEEEKIDILINEIDNETLLKELLLMQKYTREYVYIGALKVKRNLFVTTALKKLGNYKCQLCNLSISTRKGGYIETAHITPVSKGGLELLDNLVLLCPNHHVEFDRGNTEILFRNNQKIAFTMNGSYYSIILIVSQGEG